MSNPQIYGDSYFQKMRGGSEIDGLSGGPLYQGFKDLLRLEFPGRALASLRILDAGSGRGELLELLLDGGVENVWGIDFSESAVKLSRERLCKRFGLVAAGQVKYGSVTDSSQFNDRSFDAIFMTDLVEHLSPEALDAALKNANRWLVNGGKLLIHTFPTLGPHRMFQLFLFLCGRWSELRELNAIHCNVQTSRTLKRALTRAGLVPVRMWLQNDFTLTSSSYQRMKDGTAKRLVAWIMESLLAHSFVAMLVSALGLSEFARPSIYAVAFSADRSDEKLG